MPEHAESFYELRATGIGGSEVAAILGLDPDRDKFSVYADKLGLLQRSKPNARMRWGKLLEQAIAMGYAEETGFRVQWCDATRHHPDRPWQIDTPDAFAWETETTQPTHGVDCKNVGNDRAFLWGPPGSDDMPVKIALQLQWYCSAENLPAWDASALFGGNDLRIYRVHRDPEIEAVMLDEGWQFWHDHVLAHNPPPIGTSRAAGEYLKQRYPKAVEELRVATSAERALMDEMIARGEEWDHVNRAYDAVANAMKLAIGDAEGLLDGKRKVTWRRSKDSVGVAWEDVARDAIDQLAHTYVQDACPDDPSAQVALATHYVKLLRQFTTKHTRVLKQGSRRLLTNFSKLKPEER